MGLAKEIDALMLEMTRKGLKPRYIVVGRSQYMRWARESGELKLEDLANQYMGCDIVICNSDILEVVPEPKDLYDYAKRR